MSPNTLIIGAGPAGLMAAYELAKNGRTALILEARDRTGGRIRTVRGADGNPIETGAEFIHGPLPITLSLLKEAGISYTVAGGRGVQVQSGDAVDEKADSRWPVLLRKLKALQRDTSLQDFLTAHFSGPEYAALTARAVAYAEGYDTADATRASAKALYAEWSHEEEAQYRVDAGYDALTDYLAATATAAGSRVLLSHPVDSLQVGGDGVTASAGGQTFTAPHAILALPLGVLQSEEAAPRITPAAPDYSAALQSLGFGDVVKIVLRFRQAFWEEKYPGLGFLFSGAPVPTWWTQAPAKSTVLTGWIAGRRAKVQAARAEADLLRDAIASLAQIFSKDAALLEADLLESHIAAWSTDPYTRGAYAYGTVGADAARAVLARPLAGRLHFAGEYMHPDGPVMGTVEAALWSGREAVRRVG